MKIIIKILLIQGLSFFLSRALLTSIHLNLPIFLASLSGLFAALVALIFRENRLMAILYFLFPFGIQLYMHYAPSGVLLPSVILLLLWLIFRNAPTGKIPLYLSSEDAYHAVSDILSQYDPHKTISFLDIGSGLGGILFYLSEQYPHIKFYGIENAPLPFLITKILEFFKKRRPNLKFKFKSFDNQPFSEFDIIYSFLSPAPMYELLDKFLHESQPHHLFISNAFTNKHFPEEKIIHHNRCTLYLWHGYSIKKVISNS